MKGWAFLKGMHITQNIYHLMLRKDCVIDTFQVLGIFSENNVILYVITHKQFVSTPSRYCE